MFDRGQTGDMIMFGPPFIITKEQIDEAVSILREVLSIDFWASSGLIGKGSGSGDWRLQWW